MNTGWELVERVVLQQTVPLPAEWHLASGQGLRSNGGPESLKAVGGAGELLMATEQPLKQDQQGLLRRLRWQPDRRGGLVARHLQPLAIPTGHWGLTDRLVGAAGQPNLRLLGLWRRFEAPSTRQTRLVPSPWPADRADAGPLAPRKQWDLGRLGLPADNREVLLAGPPLADGRPSVVLGSDDNFNPLQASHQAGLTPRRTAACRRETHAATAP